MVGTPFAPSSGAPVFPMTYGLRPALQFDRGGGGLRKNLPVRLVAALHDTSSEMIERYYSAFIVDALDAVAASAVIALL